FPTQLRLLSSAALSAAEKRDYDHLFAARQQLFYYRVAQRLDHRFTLSVATTADRTTRAVKLPASPSRCVLRSAKEA
ncbi:hypothetical protein, partial [Burkholderia thailandensis]|uniref:hypothetical protein n=1 Tax=Burkholderia thailandensis TaxID=57975 RepID=UPI002165C89D